MAEKKIIVVGGGLAGLMSTIKAAEQGAHVDLFSIVPVKRSHSVCAQGGINGAVNTKGEGDSPWIHFDDTVYGGDFLANQPPVKAMAEAAPKIIHFICDTKAFIWHIEQPNLSPCGRWNIFNGTLKRVLYVKYRT